MKNFKECECCSVLYARYLPEESLLSGSALTLALRGDRSSLFLSVLLVFGLPDVHWDGSIRALEISNQISQRTSGVELRPVVTIKLDLSIHGLGSQFPQSFIQA